MIKIVWSELFALLNRLTIRELDQLDDDLYMKFSEAPPRDTGGNKNKYIAYIVWWGKIHPDRVQTIVDMANQKLREKAMLPLRGPVSGTHYIRWDDFTRLSSYAILYEAINYGKPPYTKDGYVSVNAILNMKEWANWKANSISDYERQLANKVELLKLGELMKLNKGRIANQPALFPINMLGST